MGSLVFPELDDPQALSEYVGIDRASWATGPRFRGIRDIPPGFHIFFIQRHPATLSILLHSDFALAAYRWSPDLEKLVSYDKDDIERIAANGLPRLMPMMGPYPSSTPEAAKWKLDSRFITLSLLDRICNSSCRVVDSMHSCSYHSLDDLSAASLPAPEKEDILSFTQIDLRLSSKGVEEKALVTKYSLDKSLLFTRLLSSQWHGDVGMFLGELQLSFLLFLTAQLFDGFEQWKVMLHLALCCDECIPNHEQFYITLLDVIESQLLECPPDLFAGEPAAACTSGPTCFLSRLLYDFFENCFGMDNIMIPLSTELKPLPARCRRLELFIQKRFGWYAEPDDGYTVVSD